MTFKMVLIQQNLNWRNMRKISEMVSESCSLLVNLLFRRLSWILDSEKFGARSGEIC